jgi:hypothetical protein
MARVPKAAPGLVFRYDYLRPREHEQGIENPKERPACILMVLAEGETLTGASIVDEGSRRAVVDFIAAEGDVVIIPIQTDPPASDQLGVKLDLKTKAYVGLPDAKVSWAIISEVNIDTWPSAGIADVPETGEWAYEKPLPGPVLALIAKSFLRLRELKRVRALARAP